MKAIAKQSIMWRVLANARAKAKALRFRFREIEASIMCFDFAKASCATVVETQREREIMWNMMFRESEVLCNQHMMSNMCDTWSSITDNRTPCFSSDLRSLAACSSLRRLPMPVNASQHSPLHVPTSSQEQVARTSSADVHSPCRRESVSSGADVHTHCEAR